MKIPTPPKNLERSGRRVWKTVLSEYELDGSAREVLAVACLALDRAEGARELIAEHGILLVDRFGQQKANPAAAIERDARGQFLSAMRQLGLDLEPIFDGPGRPAGR
ncbi:MAG TPA: P27 family phage terminase small subunit [Candidatus Sumerlaeota bacterium]|nr:P27 family phage terminase small subunit [Candidatus Sumerlaeota bacterium]